MVNFMVTFIFILCYVYSCDIKLMVNNKLYNKLIMDRLTLNFYIQYFMVTFTCFCVMLITVRLMEYGKIRKLMVKVNT